MKNAVKTGAAGLMLLILCIAAGTLLVMLAYTLPTDRVNNSLSRSAEFFADGNTYPEIIPGYPDTRLDQFTDCLMLLTAVCKTDEPLPYQAFNNARYSIEGMNPEETFVEIFQEGSADRHTNSGYARYWHGYLAVLKPLLTVFSYKQIIILNLMLQISLLAAACMIYTSNGKISAAIPLIASYLFLNPIATALSIQYSAVWIITLLLLIILAIFGESLSVQQVYYVFLVTGAATSFFDLLTYPLITLGLPLAYLILTRWTEYRKLLSEGAAAAASWAVGYAGMWSSKWVIAGAVTGKNILANAFQSAEIRAGFTSETGKTIKYLDVLRRLHYTYNSTVLKVLIAFSAVLAVIFLIKKRHVDIVKILGLLLVSLFPFIWFAVLSNHTFVHYWFTYRTLSISVYCVVAGLAAAWQRRGTTIREG